MSKLVVGYIDGKPQYRDDGPARGRVSSGPIGGSAIVGGYPVQYAVPAVARVPEPPRKRTYRAGRACLRGQAMLDRGRHDR